MDLDLFHIHGICADSRRHHDAVARHAWSVRADKTFITWLIFQNHFRIRRKAAGR